MQFFNNLKIGVRLAIALGVALIMPIGISLAGLRGMGITATHGEYIFD